MSNGSRKDNVVPILGNAVNLDEHKELREPQEGLTFLVRVPTGHGRLVHDKRLGAPTAILPGADGIYMLWGPLNKEAVEGMSPPFIAPKFLGN